MANAGYITSGSLQILEGIADLSEGLFIILSEILVFVWAISHAVYFFRTLDIPGKLKKEMEQNGFEFVPAEGE